MRIFIVSLLLVLVLFSSCRFMGGKQVRGNGQITTRETNISGFNSLDVSGALEVHLRQDAGNSARIETDANLMEYLDVYKDGNTLVVKTKDGYNLRPSRKVILYASAPGFRDIKVSGACDIIGDNQLTGSGPLSMSVSGSGDINMQVSVPDVETEVSGSGSINLKGQATNFAASISGSGEIHCLDLVTENTTLDLSGASDAEVTANKKLDINASGASDVRYRGNAVVNQNTSGAGSVRRL
jgi:hypothetical protein